MHPLFKKTKTVKILLDNEFYITPDHYNGLILCKEVLKEKKDKEGKTVFHNDVTKKYFPKMSQTLNEYLKNKIGEAENIEEMKDILLRVEIKIEKLKEIW
jgi:hypothetical protein